MTVGRVLLALLFIAAFLHCWLAPQDLRDMLGAADLPLWLFYPSMVLNGIGAACLLTGLWMAPAALTLASYCMVTSYFHFVPDDIWEMSIFVKNWAVAGALLVLFASGVRARKV